jgi:uncharacterized protein involved in outer membrane biogenesis
VQHALLGLAIALIVAIAAALAAPTYVEWDDWRPIFERQATALVGAPVRIRGRIEATILPTPAFVFRNVEIGDAQAGTGLRAGEVRGILSLNALMRASIEAEDFVLVRPEVRLVLPPKAGGPLLPVAGAAVAATDLVSFARISIERGSLVIEDRAGGGLAIFDDISATGEINGRHGPTRIDATLKQDGRVWRVRANAGRFGDDGTGRVRATLERAADGVLFDADGSLTISGITPRFDGKLVAAKRGTPGMPWQLSANAQATEEMVSLDSFELSVGADATSAELAGKVRFAPRRGGPIDGALTARRIDLDSASGVDGPRTLSAALASARDVLAPLELLPFRGRIGIAIEAVAAGGNTIREVNAEFGLRENAFAIERFEARLPGRGMVKAKGSSGGRAIFSGDASIEAEDAAVLSRWAFGGPGPLDDESLKATGRLEWTEGRVSVEQLNLSLGEAKVGGKATVAAGEGSRRPSINASLTASALDLDLVGPLLDSLRTGPGSIDLALTVDGRDLRAFGKTVRKLDASLSRTTEGVVIDRLTLEDFGGLNVRAQGKVLAPAERPSGKIDYAIEVTRPDGLVEIATRAVGSDAGSLVRRMLAFGAPLRLTGAVSGAGVAAGIEIAGKGKLADIDASVEATFDLLSQTLSEASLTLETRDSGRLVSLIGFTPGLPAPGDGTLEINLARESGGTIPVSARLSVPGSTISAEGDVRQNAEGRIEPKLTLRVDGSDLRPLFGVVARAAGEAATPAEGTARLVRTADAFELQDISLNVAKSRVRGNIRASGIEKAELGGKLSIERLVLSNLLGLALGNAADEKGFWPARLTAAPLAGATGTIDLEIAALEIADRQTALNSKFRLRLAPSEAALEDISAEFAGGKFAGHARFLRGENIGFDGSGKLTSFDVARLLAPGTWRAGARGRGEITLTLAGHGATPASLVGGLAGQGTLKLEGLEIDRLDPEAVGAVFVATEAETPPDEVGVIAALTPAFAKAPLKVARVEAPLIVASGVMRTGKILTSVGRTQISGAANFDIARLAVDGLVELEAPAPAGLTARPGATVRWRGPIGAPERGIEAAALATAITLRAMERETKRIEERDRALPRRSESSQAPVNPVEASIGAPTLPEPTPPDAATPPGQVPLPPARPRAPRSPWPEEFRHLVNPR